ncbi:hypothetical protein BGX20_008172 [Mortierella sp. AD010]|nr:hypothetical protein BGX20_008172 [Mortierella sp. AD010]
MPFDELAQMDLSSPCHYLGKGKPHPLPQQLQLHNNLVQQGYSWGTEQAIKVLSMDWQAMYQEIYQQDCLSPQDHTPEGIWPNMEDELPDAVEQNDTSDEANDQASRKRPRKALDLKQKIEIIQFFCQNRRKSMKELSDHFGIARTTIYGIIKSKESILECVRLMHQDSMMLAACRMVESPFRILEEILAAWHNHQRSRGVPMTCKKICTQGADIHRVLSCLLPEPLPPCMFSSGWLKGFKKRTVRQSSSNFETGGYDDDVVLDARLNDLASSTFENWLFEFDSGVGRNVVLFVDQSIWDTLNMGWDILRPPLRYVRIVPVPKWLSASLPLSVNIVKEFKAYFHALLLENSNARESYMLKRSKDDSHANISSYQDYSIKPPLGPASPNTTTSSYVSPNQYPKPQDKPFAVCPLNTSVSQQRLISEAWALVSSSVVIESFRTFLGEAGFSQAHCMGGAVSLKGGDTAEARLSRALKSVFSELQDWVIRYYQNHDLDTGPSSFIRERILVMRHHNDFRYCFGEAEIDFGCVRFGSKRPVGGRVKRFEHVLQKELTHKKMLLDQYNFASYVLPNLLYFQRSVSGSAEL